MLLSNPAAVEPSSHALPLTRLRCTRFSQLTASSLVLPLLSQYKGVPTHLSRDIGSEVSSAMAHTARAYQLAQGAKVREGAMDEETDASIRDLTLTATLMAVDELQPRKSADAPSNTGGYQERRPKLLTVGGELRFADSLVKSQLGAPPALNLTLPSAAAAADASAPMPTGGASACGPSAASAAPAAAAAPPPPNPSAPAAPTVTKMMQSVYPMEMPPMLPPPANRMNGRIPPRIDGSNRAAKVPAPHVSEQPAAANPNLSNLLLEVPYKRGVHTISINQRYMNHDPTLDAAFELLPSAASFGCVRVGCVARLKLKLVNVSNLPQRFVIKGPRGGSGAISVVYTPGVAAPGISIPLEVEVCSKVAADIREVVTVVTEREEIALAVDATVLDGEAYAAHLAALDGGKPKLTLPRIIGAEPRDPALYKTVPRHVDEPTLGTKRFTVPERNLGYTRPDFFAEPPSDDEMEDSPP